MADVKLSQLAATSQPSVDAGAALWSNSSINTQNAAYTLVLADALKTILCASGAGGHTVTIPPNASVAFPIGTRVRFGNLLASASVTVAPGAGVSLRNGAASASVTLTAGSLIEVQKVSANEWMVVRAP